MIEILSREIVVSAGTLYEEREVWWTARVGSAYCERRCVLEAVADVLHNLVYFPELFA